MYFVVETKPYPSPSTTRREESYYTRKPEKLLYILIFMTVNHKLRQGLSSYTRVYPSFLGVDDMRNLKKNFARAPKYTHYAVVRVRTKADFLCRYITRPGRAWAENNSQFFIQLCGMYVHVLFAIAQYICIYVLQ